MFKLDPSEDCSCECNGSPNPEGLNAEKYIKKIYDECPLRVNLRDIMVRPCHKLVVLSRE